MADREMDGQIKRDVSGSRAWRMLVSRIKDGTFGELADDWRWALSYARRYRGALALYTLLGVLGSFMGLAAGLAGKYLIDIITGFDSSRLWVAAAVMAGGVGVNIALTAMSARISARLSISLTNDIQADVFGKLIDSEWLELSRYPHGDLLNRFTDDVRTVSGGAVSWIPNAVIHLFGLGATFLVILHYDVAMAFIAFAAAPFLLFSSRWLIRRLRAYDKRMKETSGGLTSFEAEAFSNLDTLKSFGAEEKTGKKLHLWQKKYRDATLDNNLFSIKTKAWLSVLGAAVQFTAFGYCLWRLWTGAITFGTMTLFLQQRASLSGSFSGLVSLVPGALGGAVSARRVRELTELKKEAHLPPEEDSGGLEGGVTVRMTGVDFAYAERDRVITGSDFIARPGETVALIGPSGEGKTTLVRLILGLIRPENGEAALCDASGRTLPLGADTRRYFSYVPQGNTILSGTVAENLRLVREEATDAELIAALKAACAWEFVSQLPEGLDSPVGERGRGFSEGQAQRLAVARALLRDAPVLLLDEATGALDPETERALLKNIMTNGPDRTVIVTTHRPGVLSLCSRVYRVTGAKVTELSGEGGGEPDFQFQSPPDGTGGLGLG